MTDQSAPAEPVEGPVAALGLDQVAPDARLRAGRAERVARAVATNRDGHFGALWLVAKAIADHENGDLGGRPSKAAMRASHDAGYVEGLHGPRPAPCSASTQASCSMGSRWQTKGSTSRSARDRIYAASPNTALSHHPYLDGRDNE